MLLSLQGCLEETAAVLSGEPGTDRVRTAVTRLEDAGHALLPLLRERGAAGPGPVSGGPPVLREVELRPDDTASRRARAFCRAVLVEWSVTGPQAEAVVDVASELVTNAARHADAVVRVRLCRAGDDLVVSAWDDGPGQPRLRPHQPGTSERGIGLLWVEALTASWGWTHEDGGKRVWAVVARSADEDRS